MIKGKIVVGILPTRDFSENNPYEDRSRFIDMYKDKILEAGGIPIGLVDQNISMYYDLCDAYLWPGGKVIIKDLYQVFNDVLINKKPLLGICLGSQAIATFFNILEDQKSMPGKSLLEVYDTKKMDDKYLNRIDEELHEKHNNIVTKEYITIENAKHKILLEEGTFLYDIYKVREMDVVSLHAYEIARTSPNVVVSSRALDGVIESIEYHNDNNKILGIQFHPEINNDVKPFKWLIGNAYNKYKVLVNKDNKCNYSYNIVGYSSSYPKVRDENGIEEQACNAFIELRNKMMEYGFVIDLESGYRTCELQEKLYNDTLKKKGLEHTNTYVAKPGYSEHQTGLAVDICACIDDKWLVEYDIPQELYDKLHEICCNYGFILRYPLDKDVVTGYSYEPWHLRYIGDIDMCKYIMSNNLTLEEYLDNGEYNVY